MVLIPNLIKILRKYAQLSQKLASMFKKAIRSSSKSLLIKQPLARLLTKKAYALGGQTEVTSFNGPE